ncbi:MAG: XisI protein [Blastocatellia bacterium]
MDTIERYRQLVQEILWGYTRVPYANSKARFETVFDTASDHYLVMILGHEPDKRYVHGCLIHVDILGDKIWVQRDGTEYGIARELLDAGVPREHIVLGYKSPEMRKYTEFAAA